MKIYCRYSQVYTYVVATHSPILEHIPFLAAALLLLRLLCVACVGCVVGNGIGMCPHGTH